MRLLNLLKPNRGLLLLMLLALAWAGSVEARPAGAYLDGGDSKVAVILLPGRGEEAEDMVSQPLRRAIHKQLGYHTLMLKTPQSLQLDWKAHLKNFPEAYRRIQAAIDYYRNERGVKHIYLMGHSMGSRFATGFLAEYPESGISGFIGVGIRAGGPQPLHSTHNLREIEIPVVDIFGDGGDGKDAYQASYRESMVSDRYTQILIPGADHKFSRHRRAMIEAVIVWLRQQEQ